mmetsp:Transcript_5586/g.20228  ORF Transcript_5586/g.20228 Transcript_5586/m.20228 type:complete len:247 (+) Transcript_5586:124-864(+)
MISAGSSVVFVVVLVVVVVFFVSSAGGDASSFAFAAASSSGGVVGREGSASRRAFFFSLPTYPFPAMYTSPAGAFRLGPGPSSSSFSSESSESSSFDTTTEGLETFAAFRDVRRFASRTHASANATAAHAPYTSESAKIGFCIPGVAAAPSPRASAKSAWCANTKTRCSATERPAATCRHVQNRCRATSRRTTIAKSALAPAYANHAAQTCSNHTNGNDAGSQNEPRVPGAKSVRWKCSPRLWISK